MRFQFFILIALFLVAIAFAKAVPAEQESGVEEEIIEAAGPEPIIELDYDGELEGEDDDDLEVVVVDDIENDDDDEKENVSQVDDEGNDDNDGSSSNEDSANLEEDASKADSKSLDSDESDSELKPQARPLPEAQRQKH